MSNHLFHRVHRGAGRKRNTDNADYIFETIKVPGVDFLEVTSSNDFGHYAGNARHPDDDKLIGFTLIDECLFYL